MKARALHSTLTADGNIRLTLDEVDIDAIGADEVIVRVDATPVNPTDLALMLSGADLSRASESEGAVIAPVPAAVLQIFPGRIDQPLPLGAEGCGTVIAAGTSPAAQALIGKLVAKLDALGLRDNTLILFLGDNGTGRGTRSRMGDRLVIGGKGATTDAGMHVPLLASWPGRIGAGKLCPDLVDSTDFVPTMLAAAPVRDVELVRRHPGRTLPRMQGQRRIAGRNGQGQERQATEVILWQTQT